MLAGSHLPPPTPLFRASPCSLVDFFFFNPRLQLIHTFENVFPETSLVEQWIRLHTPSSGGWGSISGQGTRKKIYFFRILFYLFFIQQVLISHPFYTHQCIHVNPNLPIHPTTTIPHHFPPLVSIRLFSTAVSLFLPCKLVHLYHFSRFHMYALIYICFSPSDLLHSV